MNEGFIVLVIIGLEDYKYLIFICVVYRKMEIWKNGRFVRF